MFKKYFCILSLGLLAVLIWFRFSFAQQSESITITTYYPSPYGSYNELRTNMLAVGSNTAMPTANGDLRANRIVTGATTTIPGAAQDGDLIVGNGLWLGGVRGTTWPPFIQSGLRDNRTTGPLGEGWGTGWIEIRFSEPFAKSPVVVISRTQTAGGEEMAAVQSVTTTGFFIRGDCVGDCGGWSWYWIAVGRRP